MIYKLSHWHSAWFLKSQPHERKEPIISTKPNSRQVFSWNVFCQKGQLFQKELISILKLFTILCIVTLNPTLLFDVTLFNEKRTGFESKSFF